MWVLQVYHPAAAPELKNDKMCETVNKLLRSFAFRTHFLPLFLHQTPHCIFIHRLQLSSQSCRCSTQISVICHRCHHSSYVCCCKFGCSGDAYFPNAETCLQCSERRHHPPSVSPLCHSSNNTPGTRSLAVTAPNPSFHSTDFWIKEGRFPHLWIVLCYGAHASFHASFLVRRASKWEHFLIYTDLEWFWMGHGRL